MPGTMTRRKPAHRASSHATFVMEFAHGGGVDRVACVVRGVKLCGGRSRNGRKYPAHVLERAAALFEGKPVHIGHHFNEQTGAPLEVPPDRKFGKVKNVRAAAGGLVGDLHYNPEHSFAAPFLWACEHDPSQYCFSILARVQWRKGRDADGDTVAESILEVASVDVVTEGGTTFGVFESFNPNGSGATNMTDAKSFVAQFDGPGPLVGFLVDVLKEVREQFDPAALDLVKSIMGTALNAPATSTPAPPMSSSTPDDIAAVLAESRQRRALVDSWRGPGTGTPGGLNVRELAAACPSFR